MAKDPRTFRFSVITQKSASHFAALMSGLQRRAPSFVLGFCLSVLSITIFSTRLFAQFSISAQVTPASTTLPIVAVDNTCTSKSSVTLTATASPDPGGLTWSWSGPSGGSCSAVLSSTGPSNTTTATVYFNTAGTQNFTVTASGTGTESGGTVTAGPGSATIAVDVVGVESISVSSSVRLEEGKQLGLSDFTIVTNPPGHSSMVSVSPSLPLTLPAGGQSVTVTATCGTSSKQCTINVPTPSGSISFTGADSTDSGDTFSYTASETNALTAIYSFSGAASGSGGTLSDSAPSASGTVSIDWSAVDETTATAGAIDGSDSESIPDGSSASVAPSKLTTIAYRDFGAVGTRALAQDAYGIIKDGFSNTVLGDTVKDLVKSKGSCAPDANAPLNLTGTQAGTAWITTPAQTGNFTISSNYKATISGERHQVVAFGIDYVINPNIRVDVTAPSITSLKAAVSGKIYSVWTQAVLTTAPFRFQDGNTNGRDQNNGAASAAFGVVNKLRQFTSADGYGNIVVGRFVNNTWAELCSNRRNANFRW